jgi:hypothetical protein
MSIEDTDVVDAIGVENTSGKLVMTIEDHLDWSEERAHMRVLGDKVNAYLRAIQSGDLVRSYPDAEGRSVVIEVVSRVAIPESGLRFLEHVALTARKLDVEVRARAGSDD